MGLAFCKAFPSPTPFQNYLLHPAAAFRMAICALFSVSHIHILKEHVLPASAWVCLLCLDPSGVPAVGASWINSPKAQSKLLENNGKMRMKAYHKKSAAKFDVVLLLGSPLAFLFLAPCFNQRPAVFFCISAAACCLFLRSLCRRRCSHCVP